MVIPSKQDGLVAMVLIFFEDELENTETNIVVIAKKKSFFTRVGGCSAENRRAFLWPRQ